MVWPDVCGIGNLKKGGPGLGMAKESIKKESIKKQLMFTKDEIKNNLSNNTFMKTTVVLVKDGRIQKTVPNAVVVDGRVYYKQRIGVGEPRIVGGLFDGEGDCFEERGGTSGAPAIITGWIWTRKKRNAKIGCA